MAKIYIQECYLFKRKENNNQKSIQIIMKKTYLLISLLTIFSLNAQKTKRDEGVKLGIKGGLNVANFYGDIQDNSIRTSVHIGLVSEFVVSKVFSIQPEILFSGQGFTDDGTNAYSRKKFNYINLPIMGKFYVLKENLSIEAGPQVGFLVSSKNKTNTTNYSVQNQQVVDFGINAGAAYEFNNHVFVQTRYNLGLTNVNKSSAAFAQNYSNSVIQVSVGYFF